MRRKSGKKPYSQLEREIVDLRDGFEAIMEILEDLGFLEPPESEDEAEDTEHFEPRNEPNVIIINPEPTGIVEPKE